MLGGFLRGLGWGCLVVLGRAFFFSFLFLLFFFLMEVLIWCC